MMSLRTTTILFYLFFGYQVLFAQQDGSVSGIVKDLESGEPLPFANVFFNNSTIGTTTNERGEFVLEKLRPGSYKLVVSYMGYETFEKEVVIQSQTPLRLAVLMSPLKKVLSEISVTAKRDKEWEKLIEGFREVFLGSSENARNANILNPGVIDLSNEKGLLKATAQEPIIIENQSLGYIIHYHLKEFSVGQEDFHIAGYARFEEIKQPTNQQKVAWINNRDIAYKGSLQHFLESCINGNPEAEGFRVYFDTVDNSLPMHLARHDFFEEYKKTLIGAEPFLEISALDSLSVNIRINNRLEIHYLKEKTRKRYYPDVTHQVSRIFVQDSTLQCLLNGIITDPDNKWALWGDMTQQRIGDLLPLDYSHREGGYLQVRGKISDAKTKKAVRDANIFINRTTIGTFTSDDGQFAFTDIPDGYHDVVILKKGYAPFTSRLRVEDGKSYFLNLEIQQEEGKAKRSSSRRTRKVIPDRKKFIYTRFGIDPPDSCVILNPETLGTFREGNDNYVFTEEALIIENRHTGYQVLYHLAPFKLNSEGDLTGYYWFKPLKPTSHLEVNRFENNRRMNFQGSARHLLSAVVNQKYREEGFSLFDKAGNPVSSEIDSVKNINGYFRVDFGDVYRVEHIRANHITDLYNRLALAGSTLIRPVGTLLVNGRGVLFNSNALSFAGAMSAGRLSKALPLDYEPPPHQSVLNTISKYRESVFIATNKAYYHPGEDLFFKAFVRYTEPSLKDSLSRVLYVEFINRRKEIVHQKALKIEDGVAAGAFSLHNELPPGTYLFRAYTNWMRNFDEPYFIKSVRVLALDTNLKIDSDLLGDCEKPDRVEGLNISIQTNKKVYGSREKIEVQVVVTDSTGSPVATDFSCAVTDAEVVADWFKNEDQNERENGFSGKLLYPVERALRIQGRVVNSEAGISRVQFLNLKNQIFEETAIDSAGNFEVLLPDVFDSLNLKAVAFRGDDQVTPEIKLFDRAVPVIADFAEKWADDMDIVLDKKPGISKQYRFEEGTTVLEEVVLTGKRIEPSRRAKTSLINPQYVVKADELVSLGANILRGLQGRVPGVEIRCQYMDVDGDCRIFFTRNLGSSLLLGAEPLVLVDDVPMYGQSAGQIIGSLEPSMIDRIELQRTINVLFGSDGGDGIIAVYTKIGLDNDSFQNEAAAEYESVNVNGFSRPPVFNGPDYDAVATDADRVDYRTTLFWRPFLNTNAVSKKASVAFFAADIPTAYRIVIEGFTAANKYFRATECVAVK